MAHTDGLDIPKITFATWDQACNHHDEVEMDVGHGIKAKFNEEKYFESTIWLHNMKLKQDYNTATNPVVICAWTWWKRYVHVKHWTNGRILGKKCDECILKMALG